MDDISPLEAVEGEPGLDAANDDWGDFSSVLVQLEQQEKGDDDPDNEQDAPSELIEDNAESIEIILGGVFGMMEQVTSAVSGVEFEFDPVGKQDVIKAAIPVLKKRGDAALVKFLGDYAQEGALLIALVMLLVSARSTIKHKKLEKRQQREGHQEMEVDNGEKAATDSVL